jgi:hypothetical protein
MLLPLFVLFESHESFYFKILQTCHGFTFAGPQGKNLCQNPILVAFFGFKS